MEAIFITPESSLKSIEITYEGKKYICKIDLIEEFIQTNLFLDNKLKYKGDIFLEKIQSQIKTFLDYNIKEILEEINQLNSNNFSLIKENNKYKLKIEFIILRKKRILIIDLNENKKEITINDNYENKIKEKDNIISEFTEKIKKQNNIINNYENKIKEKDNIILELKEKIEKQNKEMDIIMKSYKL